jgi:hypothetical protein
MNEKIDRLMTTRFGVWNEYGQLREVPVGTSEGTRVPIKDPAGTKPLGN